MNAWLDCVLQSGEYDIEIDFNKIKLGCYHRWVYERGELICNKCGVINTKECCIAVDKTVNFEYWPRTYVRKQYFDALFTKIQGKEIIELGFKAYREFIASMPDPADWYDIYQHYKTWCLKDWWICWNAMCWYELDYYPLHYNLLTYVDNQWSESKRAKKKINVFYALYKIVEMTGNNLQWVPMKLRPIALTRLDAEWELICEKVGWHFKPTSKKLTKFKWK